MNKPRDPDGRNVLNKPSEAHTKVDFHKSNKKHKPDKRQLLSKGPRYKRYTPLMANRTMILEEAFNLKVPIRLPQMKPPRPGSDATKYYKYHHTIGHHTEDSWALKDKIEELIRLCTEPNLLRYHSPPSKSKTWRTSRGAKQEPRSRHKKSRRPKQAWT